MPIDSLRFTVLLRSEQTGGEVAVVEIAVPAGWGGPPLHHHEFVSGRDEFSGASQSYDPTASAETDHEEF